MAKRALIVGLAVLVPLSAYAREQLRIVGSSTVFPFVAAVAEQFGRKGEFRTPIVEATGTGGGIKMFCEGVGERYPDMVNASRHIKDSEREQCAKHGITEITELELGYDGIVLANARASDSYALTRKVLFLALARQVPKGGKLVDNPYKTWRAVDATLPDKPIVVYGPPPSSGTRDAFVELVMEVGCKEVDQMKMLVPDEKLRKHACGSMREDGAFVEAGEDDNLIVQKLSSNHDALGVFGYSFLEANGAAIKANAVDGVLPSYEAIESGTYQVARSLFVYVKRDHVGNVPGLAEFARELTSDAASGGDGYLVLKKGLLPLGDDKHTQAKENAAQLFLLKP
jgi:phosphate transport system substrate-binding protein